MKALFVRNPFTRGAGAVIGAAAALLFVAGCQSNTATRNGDPEDAAHKQAQADLQKNLQSALNDPNITAAQKERIQQQTSQADAQRAAMSGVAKPVYANKK